MNEHNASCTPCPLRAQCTQPCPDVERLLPKEAAGRISGLFGRHAMLYGIRLEARRAYVRKLVENRDLLKGRSRRVFDLRYNEGLSLEEIGRQLNIPPKVAGTSLRRARRRIMRRWRR